MIDPLDTTALTVPLDPSVGGAWLGRARREREHRLHAFAAANNLTKIDRVERPPLPGSIFELHQNTPNRWNEDVFRFPSKRRVEFGTFTYVSQGAPMRRSYIAIELAEPVPNIVLDAKSNQLLGLSTLPLPPHRSQHLSLEGDFDRSFALSCPAGYEADALYLFTPDVMANLIDEASAFDVELVDNWVILSTPGPFSPLDPEAWHRSVRAVNAILTKVEQWRRWRDDHHEPAVATSGSVNTSDTTVAASGRRLHSSSGAHGCLIGLLGIIIVGALIFLPILLPSILQNL